MRPGCRFPYCYFYPRPPRGGRHAALDLALNELGISIHALREEGDLKTNTETKEVTVFLSTPSARRATISDHQRRRHTSISIHALREEGDNQQSASYYSKSISIHALREEGDTLSQGWHFLSPIFLSTPSARRATRRITEGINYG